jgi:hypothetical protein
MAGKESGPKLRRMADAVAPFSHAKLDRPASTAWRPI